MKNNLAIYLMELKPVMRILLASIIATLFLTSAQAEFNPALKAFDGQPINIDSEKITHLIFQEIWTSYEGLGEENRVDSLPLSFRSNSQRIWIQPGLNVTLAQLAEYQSYFPKIQPLVLDEGYKLMRAFDRWDLPLHVIIDHGNVVFSGSGEELSAIANKHFISKQSIGNWAASVKASGSKIQQKNLHSKILKNIKSLDNNTYSKPQVGDKAPDFTTRTMDGETVSLVGLSYNKPLSIVFMDSLCPMPHFPGCEKKLKELNDVVENDTSRQWLGIVSSYYVDENIAKQFREKIKLTLPLIFDEGNELYRSYGVYASPYQVDINSDGSIRSRGHDIH